METSSQLGTDEWSFGKLFYILMFSIILIILTYFSVNAPESIKAMSQTYLIIGSAAIIIFLLSKTISVKKGFDFPNPIIAEKTHLFGRYEGKQMIGVVVFCAILGFILFFSVINSSLQIFATPLFQVTSGAEVMSNEAVIILTFAAAMVEDFLFFGVIPSIIFGCVYFALKQRFWIAFIISFLVTPFIFLSYHSYRYGFISADSDSVLIMGILFTTWTLIMRNLYLEAFLHSGNNIGRTLKTLYNIEILRIVLIIIFILTIFLSAVFWLRKRKK